MCPWKKYRMMHRSNHLSKFFLQTHDDTSAPSSSSCLCGLGCCSCCCLLSFAPPPHLSPFPSPSPLSPLSQTFRSLIHLFIHQCLSTACIYICMYINAIHADPDDLGTCGRGIPFSLQHFLPRWTLHGLLQTLNFSIESAALLHNLTDIPNTLQRIFTAQYKPQNRPENPLVCSTGVNLC